MNAKEQALYIGKHGMLRIQDSPLRIRVIINDVRNIRYGNVDFLVSPIGGTGEQWVSESRVTLNENINTSDKSKLASEAVIAERTGDGQ
jgi:hypothetical protein